MNAIQPAPKTRLRRLVVRLRGSGLINRSVASAALFLVAARLPAQLSAADVIFSAVIGRPQNADLLFSRVSLAFHGLGSF